jgi:hypothetical protein
MEVREDDRNATRAYANACSAVMGADEITLRFGMRQGLDRVALSHGVVLSPMTAKRLSLILTEATAQYVLRSPAGPPAPAGEGTLLPFMRALSPQARLPLDEVGALGCGFVLSGSFKVTQGDMVGKRYLMSLARSRITGDADARVLAICRTLGMPEDLVEPFAERLAPANYVHFGFEQSGEGCLYKVYMEYWTTWEEEIDLKQRSEAFVGGYGYKWDPANGRRSALTRYTCHPRLSAEAMLERVAKVCEQGRDKPVQVMRSLFDAASRRIPAERMLYLEADEEGNPRRSFDVNLLQSKVLLSELDAVWRGMCEHYGVPLERFHAFFTPIRNEPLAHIQGGVDRTGRDFITIYYGLERH